MRAARNTSLARSTWRLPPSDWRLSNTASAVRKPYPRTPGARRGDHRWWISDLDEFRADYPEWRIRYGVEQILREIYEFNAERWAAPVS